MEIIKKLEDFLLSDIDKLIMPPSDVSTRHIIHEWCEKENINSYSITSNENTHKIVIIEKKPRTLVLNINDIEKFIKDNKLPIPIAKPPYLDYFLDLYEPDYSAKTLYNEFTNAVSICKKNNTTIREYHNTLVRKIVDSIKENDTNKKYLSDKINGINIGINECNVLSCSGYTLADIDKTEKYYISLDIKKANYTSTKHFYPEIFLDTNTWEDYVKLFTDIDYFIKSKHFRQVVFGNLNTKKCLLLWKQLCVNLVDVIKEHTSLNIFGKVSDDEIIIKSSLETIDNDLVVLDSVIKKHLPDHYDYWKIIPFSIKCIAVTDTFNKFFLYTNYNTKKELLKGCDRDHFAQLYKAYYGRELHSYDFKSTINNEVITFDEPWKITLI